MIAPVQDVAYTHDGAQVTGNAAETEPLRVALVTETWEPEINGVAMTLGRLVAGLRRRGCVVSVVRPRQDDRDREPGGILRPGMSMPGYAEMRLGLPSYLQLISRWRAQRPDLVHVATEGPLGWSALRAAANLGLPVLSSFHTNFHDYSKHYGAAVIGGLVEAWLRRFHDRCGGTLVPAPDQQRRLGRAGFKRLGILGRGVDTQLFHPSRRDHELRRSFGITDDGVLLCCVGRLAAEKNLGLAVRALQAVRTQLPQAKLLLVGDGPERPAVSGIDGVILAGAQRGEALGRHYASADLFVFPSLTETWGNVTAEALASGLPVVAYRYAAAEALVSNDCGRAVPRKDEAGFLAATVEIARDDQLRRRLAAKAPAAIRRISWDLVIDGWLVSARTCIDRHRPRRVRT